MKIEPNKMYVYSKSLEEIYYPCKKDFVNNYDKRLVKNGMLRLHCSFGDLETTYSQFFGDCKMIEGTAFLVGLIYSPSGDAFINGRSI